MEPIEMRVERSLKRLGFPRVRVFRINPRRIKLVGQIGPSDEPAIAFAVARTVAGVIEVQNKIVVGERQDFVGQQAERSKTRDFTQPWPAVRHRLGTLEIWGQNGDKTGRLQQTQMKPIFDVADYLTRTLGRACNSNTTCFQRK